MAQNQLLGKWTNSYGSILEINHQSAGEVEGIYSSSTGSTGKYKVVGTYAPSGTTNGNLSVALTILWNSIDGSTKDPSQFWTSDMSGTHYAEHNSMELINTIAAAEAFQQVNVLEPGLYPESLTFKKQEHTSASFPVSPLTISNEKTISYAEHNSTKLVNTIVGTEAFQQVNVLGPSLYEPLNFKQQEYATTFSHVLPLTVSNKTTISNALVVGQWINRETSTSEYHLLIIKLDQNNLLKATLTFNSKDHHDTAAAVSLIGQFAKAGKKYQSLSMGSFPIPTAQHSVVLGITGLLNVNTNELKLIVSKTRNVAYKNKYTSNDVSIFYFDKQY